ncbi:DUF3618 domain-containing protein [Streptomyces capitiformicae]|nr:DUF3618 domain-containing protein [Streptomyces capitiformicae]
MGTSGGPKERVGAKGPDELRRQIEITRSRLGDTVEELAAKADVKGRARARVHSVRERVPRQAVAVGGAGVAALAAGLYVWRHPTTPPPAPPPLARLRRRLPSSRSLNARGRRLPSSLRSLAPRRRRLPALRSLNPRQ